MPRAFEQGVGWGLIQVADATLEPLNLPEWAGTLVIRLIALVFPIAVILAWTLDIPPKGIQVTKSAEEEAPPPLPAAPSDASIAVLPFNNMSSLGQLDEAEAAANKALELNPDIYSAPVELAVVSLFRGDPAQARASRGYPAGISCPPDPDKCTLRSG